MDQKRIQELVDEEIARRRAGELLDPDGDAKAKKKSGWLEYTRHPLFLSVFAFIVTTVIGGYYDSVLQARQQARDLRAEQVEAARIASEEAIEGLKVFSRLVNEREIRARLLHSALKRGDAEEARLRKALYDDIYFEWNRDFDLNGLKLRDFLGSGKTPTVYEYAVRREILQSFARADSCLTSAYDYSRRLGFPFPAPGDQGHPSEPRVRIPRCRGDEWDDRLVKDLRNIRTCNGAILRTMIPDIRVRTQRRLANPQSTPEKAEPIVLAGYWMKDQGWDKDIYAALKQGCPAMPDQKDIQPDPAQAPTPTSTPEDQPSTTASESIETGAIKQ